MLDVSNRSSLVAALAIGAVLGPVVFAQAPAIDADGAVEPSIANDVLLAPSGEVEDPVDTAENRIAVGEYLEAINIAELEVESIEQRSNRYNLELARPLVVLGDALAGVGDRLGALGAYDRALHITRINRGLHHPSQVDIVYREATMLAATGDTARANRRHEYAYNILLRSHGGLSPDLLPGIFSLADWYLVNYNIFSARSLYQHALSVASENLSADDPARLRALRSVAATYRSERFPPYQPDRDAPPRSGGYARFPYGTMPPINNFAKGERALIEVIRIVMRSEASSDEAIATAILELGDWFLMFNKHDRATTLYRRVWEILQSDPRTLATTFDSPTPLYLPLPGDPEENETVSGRPRDGVVEMSFRVDKSGSVRGITTVQSEPKDLMDTEVRRALLRARYRPAFDGEKTLATDDVRVSHKFVYYDEDRATDSASNTTTNGPRSDLAVIPTAGAFPRRMQ